MAGLDSGFDLGASGGLFLQIGPEVHHVVDGDFAVDIGGGSGENGSRGRGDEKLGMSQNQNYDLEALVFLRQTT